MDLYRCAAQDWYAVAVAMSAEFCTGEVRYLVLDFTPVVTADYSAMEASSS